MANPEDIKTIKQLEEEVEKVFLIADKGLVKMVCACVIANRMDLDPVWLMLVAPSSSGKTEMIQAVSGLDFIHPISDLTPNTFASGMKKTGKETSLLHKINNGIMAFKDFTSILGKNRDAKREIMGQLREIFDGEYVKRTGTGDDVMWRGKIGAIAGSTEAIYSYMEDMSSMGDRFVMYSIEQPDRIEVSMRALENAPDMLAKREHLKQCFTSYITHVIDHVYNMDNEIGLDSATKTELLHVADFATKARSAVIENFKTGLIEFVPSAEMPMRVVSQLYTIATAFVAMYIADPDNKNIKMNEIRLFDNDKKLLYKTAFDSISKSRRNVLRLLAMYGKGVTTKGIATKLNLPTDSVKRYLSQINALGLCYRFIGGGNQGDRWKLKEEYRMVIAELERINVIDEQLESDTEDDEELEALERNQQKKHVDELQDLDFGGINLSDLEKEAMEISKLPL